MNTSYFPYERYEIGSTVDPGVVRDVAATWFRTNNGLLFVMEPTKTREIMVDFLTNISVAG